VVFVETWEWIALAFGVAGAVILVAAVASVAVSRRRSRQLKERFGSEYDRAVSAAGTRDAERRLADIEDRHEELRIRRLPAPARERYLEEWRQTEARFVSDPQDAVRAAERIVVRVLEDRGYPGDDDLEERAAHVAADYPDVGERYRHAHDMLHEADQSTESLRKAMIDLRAVLEELLVREPSAA
jgi:hypothetical protein